MPTPSDSTIRDALGDAIATAAPLAVVYRWWVLGQDDSQWPGLLRSSLDTDADGRKRVHGYVITRRGSTGEYVGNKTAARRTHTYWILGFHYYSTGTQSSNSEDTFSAEIDAIMDSLDDKASAVSALSRMEPVAWDFDLKSFGGELIHIARGVLTVTPCG